MDKERIRVEEIKMIKLKKILEAKDYRDVSNKFKSVLDNLPDKAFTTKNIEKIIKKLREKRPDSAMAYAKDAGVPIAVATEQEESEDDLDQSGDD